MHRGIKTYGRSCALKAEIGVRFPLVGSAMSCFHIILVFVQPDRLCLCKRIPLPFASRSDR
jgi:hypothetical protein